MEHLHNKVELLDVSTTMYPVKLEVDVKNLKGRRGV
jgi:hypothetical protein